MYNSSNPVIAISYTGILLLIVLWGCSSPAPLQEDTSESTSQNQQAERAEKTSDLSTGEGLWLVSQLDGATYQKLQSKGLQLDPDTIYNSNGSSLSNAVLKIEGSDNSKGTGAFVSDQGLVLTNYRTTLSGIANAGTPQQQLLQNGHYAENQQQEIPLKNYSLYILLEQKEVTSEINNQLSDSLTFDEKKKQAQQIKEQLITQHKSGNENLAVEINEAWGGNRQFISVYQKIEDVRLVHSPPQPVAFPSEDGYTQSWPSFASDYTFLRAYVSPNGQSRSYDDSNIPYKPQHHLQITPSKIEPGDQILTLGYPGQTHRQESSSAIKFYHNHRNPVLIDSYKAILKVAKQVARNDSARAEKYAPKQMVATQNLTYYRQLQSSFANDSSAAEKSNLEQQFTEWIKKDSLRNIQYRRVLPQLKQAYQIASQSGDLLFTLVNIFNNSKLIQIAGLYNSYYQHINDSSNTEISRSDKSRLLNQHQSILDGINVESQTQLLADMLHILSTLPEGKVPFHLMQLFGDSDGEALKNNIRAYLKNQQKESIIFDIEHAKTFLELPADSARSQSVDDMVKLYQELLDSYEFSRKNYSQHVPYLEPAQKRYVKGMMEFQDDIFPYPDANGTLRLSLGHINKFKPQENTTHPAITVTNNQIANFISTNDITGGSYGSPALNKNGKLMGLTSYRTPEGIGSDFLFNPKLHRTINVDIGYILSLVSEFSNTQRLFEEMHIQE